MKKIFTLIAALTISAGAWAQSVEYLTTFDFSSAAITTEGSTSVELTQNGVTVSVSTPVASGLSSGTTTYALSQEQITSLNNNVNSTSFTSDIAQTYISAGAKTSDADLTITISGLTASAAYNISLVSGLTFEGAGSWNSIKSDNTCVSSTPELGTQSIKVRELTHYVINSMVANSDGEIILTVDNTNGSHTAVINALAIAKAPDTGAPEAPVFDPYRVYTIKAAKAQRGYLTYNANAGVYGGPGLADVTLVQGGDNFATRHPQSTDAGVSIDWQIYTNDEDGTAKIFNLQSGMCLVADGDYVKWGAEGTDFTVTEESDGTFHFKANGKYLCAACGWYEREGAVRMVESHEDACDFEIVDLGDVDFDNMNGFVIGETGYATFYSDQPVFVPYGVTAYVLEASGEYLVATATGTIPANTGVVLAGEADLYYVFPKTNVHDVTSCLSGTTVEKDAPANCYVLGKEDDEVGFYKYTGTLAANKAYYVAPTGSESNYRVSFGELTSIISAAQQNGGQAIFDLQGRRVVNAKGINIVNGKKVIR